MLSVESFKEIETLSPSEKQKIQTEFVELSTKWNDIQQLLNDRHSKIETNIQNYTSLENEIVNIETWFKEIDNFTVENERKVVNIEMDSLQEILDQSNVSTCFGLLLHITLKKYLHNIFIMKIICTSYEDNT